MQKENGINVELVERHIKKYDQLNRLTEFFITKTGKSIQKNAKKLIFWQTAMLNTNLMDDPEHRKEFQRIVDMVQHLAVLSSQFSKEDILSLLSFISNNTEVAHGMLFENKFPGLLNATHKEELEVCYE
jgi:hypothetical protein